MKNTASKTKYIKLAILLQAFFAIVSSLFFPVLEYRNNQEYSSLSVYLKEGGSLSDSFGTVDEEMAGNDLMNHSHFAFNEIIINPRDQGRKNGNRVYSEDLDRPVFNLNEESTIHQIEDEFYAEKEFNFEEERTLASKTKNSLKINEPADGSNSISAVPNNPYVNKTVMGFAPYWGLSRYRNYEMQNLSVIAYFAVACFPDGSLVKTCVNGYCGDKSGWDGWNSTTLANMVDEAHANGVKVVLTIKNFDRPSIETLISNQSSQDRLFNNIINEINDKGVDGVNIDFEAIGTATDTQRAQFADFMDDLADRVHSEIPGSHVSVDVIGSSAIYDLMYDIEALGKTSIDAIMVMSYDFHTTRYYEGKKAGPTSPLYGNQYWYTVSRAMRDMKAQAPARKLIMGVPYYGLEFPVSGSSWANKNGTVVGSGAIGSYSFITDPEFDDWHNKDTIQWDSGEKMTWYRYRWEDPLSGPDYWQGYYDDAKSLGAKYDFVHQEGLGGIGIWALGYDDGRDELWRVMREKFSKEPFMVIFNEDVDSSAVEAKINALGGEQCRVSVNESGPQITSDMPRTQPVLYLCPNGNEVSYDIIRRYESDSDVQWVGYYDTRKRL